MTTAYLLTTAALQLLFGKFYTFLSITWVYMTAIFIFEVGSLICGVAQNSVTLIIGRAVAGLGSAGLFSGALLILAHSVPLATRPLYTCVTLFLKPHSNNADRSPVALSVVSTELLLSQVPYLVVSSLTK